LRRARPGEDRVMFRSHPRTVPSQD
jgi:hypothetical protein